MDTIKKDLLQLILHVKIYDDFDNILKRMKSKNEKGKYFEMFCKLYFLLIPTCKIEYEAMYLYSEVPDEINRKIKLPSRDMGIDGIAVTHNKENYAVQVKYRKDKQTIPFGELATFPALSFGSDCENIAKGIFFTNCHDVCDRLKADKFIHMTYSCFDKCNNEFWDNARTYLAQNVVIELHPRIPFTYQEKILQIAKIYFEANDYGRLYMACGSGKSLVAFWIAIDVLGAKKIFIVVPSLYLLSATYDTWAQQISKLNFKFLLIGSDCDCGAEQSSANLYEYTLTTNKNNIEQFLLANDSNAIVITTYQSSFLLREVCEKIKYQFDFGIYDEAHRTVGESDKKFTTLLSCKNLSKKRLLMTATEKVMHSKHASKNILSMDKVDTYGNVIHTYSTKQAIDDEQLSDYKIIAPFVSTDTLADIIENNKYVKLSTSANTQSQCVLSDSDASLSSIDISSLSITEENITGHHLLTALMVADTIKDGDVHHMLVFANSNETAKKIADLIEKILARDKISGIFVKQMDGVMNMKRRRKYVRQFEQATCGIICSARIFGEGVDIPICDSVCFVDNKNSTVDIIQFVGRCIRKYSLNPNKIANVIVPFVLDNDDNFFDNKNESFKKLRKILEKLGNTDDTVSEKFFLKDCNKISYRNETVHESKAIEFVAKEININEIRGKIISKVFDKHGNLENRIRKIIINENKLRQSNEIIDTKNKCEKYLKEEGEMTMPEVQNWVKFCVGDNVFAGMKEQYYYDKYKLKKACIFAGIHCFDTYKKKYTVNDKLPHPDYVNDGFYHDLDPKFNLNVLLNDGELEI